MLLYWLKIPDEVWSEEDRKLLHQVSAKRQKKCQCYHLDIDKKLCLYSALLLKMKLSQNYGISQEQMCFDTTAYGKPYLKSSQKIFFNLSHSGNYVLCGMDAKADLGVDLQKVESPPYEIMSSCFHPQEQQYIQMAEEKLRQRRFYEIWTRKEAYLKWLGTGLINDLQKLNTLDKALESHFYTCYLPDYVCSIYSETQEIVGIKEVSFMCLQNYYVEYSLPHMPDNKVQILQ